MPPRAISSPMRTGPTASGTDAAAVGACGQGPSPGGVPSRGVGGRDEPPGAEAEPNAATSPAVRTGAERGGDGPAPLVRVRSGVVRGVQAVPLAPGSPTGLAFGHEHPELGRTAGGPGTRRVPSSSRNDPAGRSIEAETSIDS